MTHEQKPNNTDDNHSHEILNIEDSDSTLDVNDYMDDHDSVDHFDFDEHSFDNDSDNVDEEYSKKTINWFNIFLIGFLFIVIGGISYVYVPSILNNANPSGSTVERTVVDGTESTDIKQSLIQEAVEATQDNQAEITPPAITGLLSNPNQLDNYTENAAVSQESQNTYDEKLFDSLNTTILDESDDLTLDDTSSTKPLPKPSDEKLPFDDLGLEPASIPNTVQNDYSNTLMDNQSEIFADDNEATLSEDDSRSDASSLPQSNIVDIYAQQLQNIETLQPEPSTSSSSDSKIQELSIPTVDNARMQPQDVAVNENIENTLSMRIDEISSRIDELFLLFENQKEPTQNAQQLVQPANHAMAADVEHIEKTLSDLNKRINLIENKNKESLLESRTSKIQPPVPSQLAARVKPELDMTSLQRGQSDVLFDVNNTPIPRSSQWELRGASPGQAYIAELGSTIIRTIRVGDKVENLGRVKSIAFEGSRWVVRGTQSMIEQQ